MQNQQEAYLKGLLLNLFKRRTYVSSNQVKDLQIEAFYKGNTERKGEISLPFGIWENLLFLTCVYFCQWLMMPAIVLVGRDSVRIADTLGKFRKGGVELANANQSISINQPINQLINPGCHAGQSVKCQKLGSHQCRGFPRDSSNPPTKEPSVAL